MSETYDVAVDPAAGSRVRAIEAVFVCEPGRKPFAAIEAAKAAFYDAARRHASLDWHLTAVDGGHFVVGVPRNG